MTLVVKEKDMFYFMGDYNGACLDIKKNEENKFLLIYKDRVEPIAIYNKLENIQYVMEQIFTALYMEKKIIYFPPRDSNFKKEDVQFN